MYFAVKHSHMMFVMVSVVLFYFRFFKQQVRGKVLPKWLKIVPHIIDTLLLISALVLCILIQQYPIVHSWLTYKLAFVIGYIVLAMRAMKIEVTQAGDKKLAIAFMALATVCLGLAAKLAVTKTLI